MYCVNSEIYVPKCSYFIKKLNFVIVEVSVRRVNILGHINLYFIKNQIQKYFIFWGRTWTFTRPVSAISALWFVILRFIPFKWIDLNMKNKILLTPWWVCSWNSAAVHGKNRTVAISAIERKEKMFESKRRRKAENYPLYILAFKFTYIYLYFVQN